MSSRLCAGLHPYPQRPSTTACFHVHGGLCRRFFSFSFLLSHLSPLSLSLSLCRGECASLCHSLFLLVLHRPSQLKGSLLPTLCLPLLHGWLKTEGYPLKPDPKQRRPHPAPQLLQDLRAQADRPRCPRTQALHSRERGVSAESSSAVREGAACPDLGACMGVEKLNVSVTTGDI